MKVRLTQIDGSMPNLALMNLAHWHRSRGDDIVVTRRIERDMFEPEYDIVYGSAIFKFSQMKLMRFMSQWPGAIVGGTGTPFAHRVEDVIGEAHDGIDYSGYPEVDYSIGFTQRGCRFSCDFCVVPKKEGRVKHASVIGDIWRGSPHPRKLHLLDNDFFGNPKWRDRIDEIRDGEFKVCISQGINVRKLSESGAEAVASIDYRDTEFKAKRIYTAWDNKDDEDALFRGLSRLVKHGVKPDHIMIYMLVGFWPGETMAERIYRQARLREFGVRPYPMPFVRTKELVGFQRWVVGAYDKRISWPQWEAANYRPENLGLQTSNANFDIEAEQMPLAAA